MHKAGWYDRNQMKILRASLLVVFVMMILGGIYISHEIRVATQRANASAEAVTLLSKNLDTSRKQLSDHGITPSAPPAKTVVEQVGGVPGAAGSPGKNGSDGTPGPSGSPGAPGPSGQPGEPGQEGSPGTTGQIGPSGAPGTNGTDGTDGTDGKDGAAGPAGAAGQDGKNGTDGTNGKDGKDGAPPAGWTYTDPSGVQYTCSPVSGTDSAAPHYACTPDTATPSPTSSPADAGFLASGGSPNPSRQMPVTMSVAYAIVSDRKRL